MNYFSTLSFCSIAWIVRVARRGFETKSSMFFGDESSSEAMAMHVKVKYDTSSRAFFKPLCNMHRWNLITEKLIIRGGWEGLKNSTLSDVAPFSMFPTLVWWVNTANCMSCEFILHFSLHPLFHSTTRDSYLLFRFVIIIKRCMLMNDLPTCRSHKKGELFHVRNNSKLKGLVLKWLEKLGKCCLII